VVSGGPSIMATALGKDQLNTGMGFGLDDEYMNTAVVSFTTTDNCDYAVNGLTVCETFNLACQEDNDGRYN